MKLQNRLASIKEPQLIKRVMVSAIHNLGDAIMATASFDLLRKKLPEVEIDVLTKKEVADIYHGLPTINEVFHYEAGSDNNLFYFFSLMRRKPYDVFISFDRKSKPAIAACLSGIRWRVAPSNCLGHVKPKRRANFWYNLIIPLNSNESYLAPEMFQTIIRRAFMIEGRGRISLPPYSASQMEKAKAIIPVENQPVIGLSVKAERSCKNWPSERFVELIRHLAGIYGSAFFYITGAPADLPYIDELIDRAAPVKIANLAGQTSLMEMAALVSRSDLFITLDTGAAHLAANSGLKKIICLFGCTSPRIIAGAIEAASIVWSGFDERSHDPLEAANAAKAADIIDIDTVFEEAARLLNSNEPKPNFINCRSKPRAGQRAAAASALITPGPNRGNAPPQLR